MGLPATDYFPVGDIALLADRLCSKIANGDARVDYDLGKYDWDTIARQVAAVYGRPAGEA